MANNPETTGHRPPQVPLPDMRLIRYQGRIPADEILEKDCVVVSYITAQPSLMKGGKIPAWNLTTEETALCLHLEP